MGASGILQIAAVIAIAVAGFRLIVLLSRHWTRRNDLRAKTEMYHSSMVPMLVVITGMFADSLLRDAPSEWKSISQLVLAVSFGLALAPVLMKLSGRTRVEFVK